MEVVLKVVQIIISNHDYLGPKIPKLIWQHLA